jgi:hypothetical protein
MIWKNNNSSELTVKKRYQVPYSMRVSTEAFGFERLSVTLHFI